LGPVFIQEFTVIRLRVVPLLKRRVYTEPGFLPEHALVVTEHLLNILPRGHAKCPIIFAEEVTTKVVGNVTGSLEL
jgi:hypothetical protein